MVARPLAFSCLLTLTPAIEATSDATFRAYDGHWTDTGVFLFSMITLMITVFFVLLTFFLAALIDCKCCTKSSTSTTSKLETDIRHVEKAEESNRVKTYKVELKPASSHSIKDTKSSKKPKKEKVDEAGTSSTTHTDKDKKKEATNVEKGETTCAPKQSETQLTQLKTTSLFAE